MPFVSTLSWVPGSRPRWGPGSTSRFRFCRDQECRVPIFILAGVGDDELCVDVRIIEREDPDGRPHRLESSSLTVDFGDPQVKVVEGRAPAVS